MDADAIKKIEQIGHIDIEVQGKCITLEREAVEILSQDIEGWLVANEGQVTRDAQPASINDNSTYRFKIFPNPTLEFLNINSLSLDSY